MYSRYAWLLQSYCWNVISSGTTVKTGETKTSCTDKLSNWNNKKGKRAFKPLKAVEVVWRKGHYTKNIGEAEEEKEKQELKHKFKPLNKRQKEEVKNQRSFRNTLYNLLKDDIKDSCFSLIQEKRRIEAVKPELPPSFLEIAESLKKAVTVMQM